MKITTINSIEVSSLCNNKCQYCPAPLQSSYRKTGLMDMDIFKKALEWVLYFSRRGTQQELNLFGVGEPTLNPDLVEMAAMAKRHLSVNKPLHLNTNGVLMTPQLAMDLKKAGVDKIDITGHDHYITARTVKIFKKIGMPSTVSYDFAISPNNWAGQVDWFEPDYRYPCPWLGRGQIMVMSTGDITTCCLDAFGRGIFTNVNENIALAELKPFDTCSSCHHIVPEKI